MPKRVIDGEALWASGKISQVEPERYRAELAWLIPLAMARGTFECSPRVIWGRCYAVNRPDWTVEDVTKLLDEFQRVKLLFRWQEPDGKHWGYWVGVEKPGRLPSAARLKERHEREGAAVPQQKLAEFLGRTTGYQQEPVGQPIGSLGSGSGSGLGFGIGSGSGSGFVPSQPISSNHTAKDTSLSEQEEKQSQPISSQLPDRDKSFSGQGEKKPELPASSPSEKTSPAPEEQSKAAALCELLGDLIDRPLAADWLTDAEAILAALPFETVAANTRWALDGVQDPAASKFWRRCTFSMKNLRDHFLRAPADGNSLPPIRAQYQQFLKRQQKNKMPAEVQAAISVHATAQKWGATVNE